MHTQAWVYTKMRQAWHVLPQAKKWARLSGKDGSGCDLVPRPRHWGYVTEGCPVIRTLACLRFAA